MARVSLDSRSCPLARASRPASRPERRSVNVGKCATPSAPTSKDAAFLESFRDKKRSRHDAARRAFRLADTLIYVSIFSSPKEASPD
jgi:hypothetical protein